MIPYAAGLVAMVFISRSSDKRLERRLHAAIPALFAGAAMAVLGAPDSVAITVALLGMAVAGMYSVFGPTNPAASAIGLVNPSPPANAAAVINVLGSQNAAPS